MNLTPDERAAIEAGDFAESVRTQVRYGAGKPFERATNHDLLQAVSHLCRRWAVDRMLETEDRVRAAQAKRLYYLSVEFLLGRTLESSLHSLLALDPVKSALAELDVDLDALVSMEPDAGLGNGGLGRLAACYLDSLATRNLPGFGYGINYEYGLFRQVIAGDEQLERPDAWRRLGSPWLIRRPERTVSVPVYGKVGRRPGGSAGSWTDASMIIGIPHDMPVIGYGGETVNWLRLYTAETVGEMDVDLFNSGDYLRAFERKLSTERISKLLYPSTSTDAGLELRLLQDYFFVACAVRDLTRRFMDECGDLEALPDRVAIQLNDAHPALAVPELIRFLVDEHGFDFDRAVELTRATVAYTNHTLLPEALQTYSRPLLAHVVPRHLQIIEELNGRFLADVERSWPGDMGRMRRMSVVEESHPQHIRMANLAIIGSHHVNGVSEMHSELVRQKLVPDFAEQRPDAFVNVTNGISPRRWLLQANPGLARLVTERIGRGWIRDLEQLARLEPHVDDPDFREAFRGVKRENKVRLAEFVRESMGAAIDPDSLFDVQVKRIHLYKRQLLAALHAVHLYLRIHEDGESLPVPRTCIFAGKAAPGYFLAKLVIRLLNAVGRQIASDPRAREQLQVVFVPDYRVSLAERIIPAADVSEQISTAGFEASGTGNMKLALNGALTVGTLDGANVEIRDAVGEENLYVFGLRAEEIEQLREGYDPHAVTAKSPALARVLDAVAKDRFSAETPGVFGALLRHLFEDGDPYCVLADFDAYCAVQERVSADFLDGDAWTRRAALNTARTGRFSSDRAVVEYSERIWGLRPIP
ncbi:MAG: glycogen/starch/alpha-glucan phosphorylase [Myxococcales bacterium]|nr:glycogen/starch/alpha-glucan phosphorylase [Myxococcales bacterium]